MQTTNRDGIVIKQGGVLNTTSEYSALSGERLGSGTVTLPVRGMPGLFVRLGPSEARQLTDAQRDQVEARARAWAVREMAEPEQDDSDGKIVNFTNLNEVIDGDDPESEEQQHDQSPEV